MTPKQLTQFLAACKHGSISSAADELNIAQPALSKQISHLEHELEVELFSRHSRGVKLTRAGHRLRKEAVEVIRSLDNLKLAIQQVDVDISGDVTLAVISSLAPAFAVELYPRIEQEYPGINLRIVDYSSDRAVAALLQNEVDLAIVPNVAADMPGANSLPLFQEQFMFLSRAMPGTRARPITLAEAASQPLILPFHGVDLRRRIEEAARGIGAELNIKYESGSINVITQLVEKGLASSIVPMTFSLDRIESGFLMTRPVIRPTISRIHSICWVPDIPMSSATRIVREMIQLGMQAMLLSGKISGKAA